MDGKDVRDAGEDVRDAVDSAPVRVAGRVGLAAYGVVHLLLAWLALRIAFGISDAASGAVVAAGADKSGALRTLAATGGGRTLLWVITIGLVALIAWQLTETIWGHRHTRPIRRRRLRQAVSAGEVVLFGLLAVSAAKLAAGGSDTSGAEQAGATATVLSWPGGPLLVGAIGVGVVVVGGYLVYRGVTKAFLRHLDLSGARPAVRALVVRTGQLGWAALGVVYGTFGVLVVIAAVRFDPGRVTGLDQALKTLAAQPFGRLLLVAVSLGLACYGVFCLLESWYRKA